jgi:hypothetical protein
MKSSMKSYAAMFGDFIINDGTHNTDMYGLILMMNTLVDSLGMSIMSSYSQFRSEHSDHLERALMHFGLGADGVTFMTDAGPAYYIIAERFKLIHVLCTKHYHNQIFPACAGLGNMGEEFKKDMFAAIYNNFKSAGALAAHFQSCLQKYGSGASALKFITALLGDQKLVCQTHTTLVFSAGCKATQRGEGSNARLKIGQKKRELRKFNLFQLMQWYLDEVELQEEKALVTIIKLLDNKRQWSDFVEQIWQAQSSQVLAF